MLCVRCEFLVPCRLVFVSCKSSVVGGAVAGLWRVDVHWCVGWRRLVDRLVETEVGGL